MSDKDINRTYKLLCYEFATIRKDKKLSQQDVSKRLNISAGYLSKIESGLVTNVSLKVLMKLCDVYNKNFTNVYEIAKQKMELENKQKE